MEELLKEMLEQMKYQTKLLETLVEGTSLGGGNAQAKEAAVDNAMSLLCTMPMFANIDREKLVSMLKGGGQ